MSGDIFYGTTGPRNAKIAIVGESWGANEKRLAKPFVGATGDELIKILAECGIPHNQCFITNVISEKPYGNDMWSFFHTTKKGRGEGFPCIRGLYPQANIMGGVETLKYQLAEVKPEIVIGFGNYASWALTDDAFGVGDKYGRKVPTGIGSWRGSQLYCREEMGGFRYLPTYHPASIFRNWPWRYDLVHDIKSRVHKALKDQWDEPDYRFSIRPSFEQVMTILDMLDKKAKDAPIWLAEDIETSREHMTCIGVAWSNLDAMCIPFTYDGTMEPYWMEHEEQEIILAWRKLHRNPNIKVVGMNFLYDAQYLALFMGYIPTCAADVMLLHHCCWPGKPKSLAYISSLYNFFHRFWKDEGKEWHPEFSNENHWSYNCKDCVNTYESNLALQGLVDHLDLREQADLQMEQFALCLDMMMRGVKINGKARALFTKELGDLLDSRQAWLAGIIPEDVYPPKPKASAWYRSPAQTGEIFYDILGIDEVKGKGKGSAKGRTVNDAALSFIARREPIIAPICQAIQEIRSIEKFKTNFCEAELEPDGRLSCQFDPSGTKAFRWNSSQNAFHRGANLQTIPKGTEEDD